jgi:hypothetical protein
MRKLVTENPKETILVKQQMFTRVKNLWHVKTPIVEKRYRYVYDKRVMDPETFCTLPYGY